MDGQAATETKKASIPTGADTGGDSENMEESNSSALNESRFSESNPANPESRFSGEAEDKAKVSESVDAPAKAIVETYHSCRKDWLFQNPSGALSVAANHGKDWERWLNDCFTETKSKTNQATCLTYYNVEGIDEGFAPLDINNDFKEIDPKLNKAGKEADADGKRVRFAKLLDKNIQMNGKYAWIKLDKLPLYDDDGLVGDWEKKLDAVAALLYLHHGIRIVPIWRQEIEMDFEYATFVSDRNGSAIYTRLHLPVNIELAHQIEEGQTDWKSHSQHHPLGFVTSAALSQSKLRNTKRSRPMRGFLYMGESENHTAIGSPMAFIDAEQLAHEVNGSYVDASKLLETYGKRAIIDAIRKVLNEWHAELDEEEKELLPLSTIQIFYTKTGYGQHGKHFEQKVQHQRKAARQSFNIYGPIDLNSHTVLMGSMTRMSLTLQKYSQSTKGMKDITVAVELRQPTADTVKGYNTSSYSRRVSTEQDVKATITRPIDLDEYRKASKGLPFVSGGDVAVLLESYEAADINVPKLMEQMAETDLHMPRGVTTILNERAFPEKHFHGVNYYQGFVRGYEGLNGTWDGCDRGIIFLSDPRLVTAVIKNIKTHHKDHVRSAKRLFDANGWEVGSFDLREYCGTFANKKRAMSRPYAAEYKEMLAKLKAGNHDLSALRLGDERKKGKDANEKTRHMRALMRGDDEAFEGHSSSITAGAAQIQMRAIALNQNKERSKPELAREKKKARLRMHQMKDMLAEVTAEAAVAIADRPLTDDETRVMASQVSDAIKEGAKSGEEIREENKKRMLKQAVLDAVSHEEIFDALSPSKKSRREAPAGGDGSIARESRGGRGGGRGAGAATSQRRVQFNTDDTAATTKITATAKRVRSPAKKGADSPSRRGGSKQRVSNSAASSTKTSLTGELEAAAGDTDDESDGVMHLDMADITESLREAETEGGKTPAVKPAAKQPTMTLTPTIEPATRKEELIDDAAERLMKDHTVTIKMLSLYERKRAKAPKEEAARERIWTTCTQTDLESDEWQTEDYGQCAEVSNGAKGECKKDDLCAYCQKRVNASKDHQLRIAYALDKKEQFTQVKEYHNNESKFVTHCYYTGLIEDDASLVPESLWRPP
jgi:hypothetical protein